MGIPEINYCDPVAFNVLLRLRRERGERRISWRAVSLGMAVAGFANTDGDAWPSRATLERMTGIESRDIPRVTRELVLAGFMTIQEREGHSNIYHLTYGEIAACGKSPMGKQPPTCGETAAKGMGKQPPITINRTIQEQCICTKQPKPPFEEPNHKGEMKLTSLPQGNHHPSPAPSTESGDGGKKEPPAKVTWDGTRLIVPDVFLASWSESHPHVDLQAAIRKASSWCLANPGKRPKKDFARFLNGWFGRVKPGDAEYIDPDEQAASDAALIREVEFAIDDPDERADYWYRCQRRGEYVPHGVDCRPMPGTIEEMRQAERKGAV